MCKKLMEDDFLKTKIPTNLQIDPRGDYLYYIVSEFKLDENRYERSLWQYDLKKQTTGKILLGFEPKAYTFKEDFLFVWENTGEQTTFYSYDPKVSKTEAVCSVPFIVSSVGCGRKLYFTAAIRNDQVNLNVATSESAPFFTEGQGVRGRTVNALFEADYTGKQVRVLTGLEMDINLIDFDLSRNRIAFTAFKSAHLKPIASCVYTYDVLTDVLLKFTNSEYRIDGLQAMSDTSIYFAGVNLSQSNRNDNQQVYQVNLTSGQVCQVGQHLDMSNESPVIVTDSMFAEGSTQKCYKDTYYHLRVAEDRQVICLQEKDGTRRCIDTGLKSITSFDVSGDAIYLIGMKDLKLLELYKYDGTHLSQLTELGGWLDAYTLSRPEPMRVQTSTEEIRGWVYPPIDDHKESAPAVLMIHGGPKMVYSDVFAFDIQLLCAKGYFVLCANPMGSDGRGDAFADIRGRFYELPYEQLMAFVDEALNTFPRIDEEALGVTGGSYGGYMTNHIITRTHRFRAAVSERGISNMMSALTASDIGFAYVSEYADQRDLWTHPQVLLDMSPVLFAGAVKTPTLFNHGKDDFRCHYTESLNMYSALVQQGIPARLCLYEGENHSLVTRGRPKSKLTRYQELTRWFDRCLKRG